MLQCSNPPSTINYHPFSVTKTMPFCRFQSSCEDLLPKSTQTPKLRYWDKNLVIRRSLLLLLTFLRRVRCIVRRIMGFILVGQEVRRWRKKAMCCLILWILFKLQGSRRIKWSCLMLLCPDCWNLDLKTVRIEKGSRQPKLCNYARLSPNTTWNPSHACTDL